MAQLIVCAELGFQYIGIRAIAIRVSTDALKKKTINATLGNCVESWCGTKLYIDQEHKSIQYIGFKSL